MKEQSIGERALDFARAHPGVAIAAAAGVGLFGGLEVAAGVMFGAGIAALVGVRSGEEAAKKLRERARDVRERARGIVDRVREKSHARSAATNSH